MESGDLENRDFLSTSSRESLTDELNWTRGCMKKENRRGVKLGKRERERGEMQWEADQHGIEKVGGRGGWEDREVAEGLSESRQGVQGHLRSHLYHLRQQGWRRTNTITVRHNFLQIACTWDFWPKTFYSLFSNLESCKNWSTRSQLLSKAHQCSG